MKNWWQRLYEDWSGRCYIHKVPKVVVGTFYAFTYPGASEDMYACPICFKEGK